MRNRKFGIVLILGFWTLSAAGALHAQQAGMNVTRSGQINEDVYTAGGTVQVLADVTGDVVAAGGNVTITDSVSGDVLSLGGTVAIAADVQDDIRAVGGTVSVSGNVGGDAVIAGGSVTISPTSTVRGRAWLAGGEIHLAGDVGGELKAAGGDVVVSSTIDSDAQIYAQSLVIEPGAVIKGNLTYISPRQAVIAEGARIDGEINWRESDFDHGIGDTGWDFGATVLFFLSFAVSAIVFSLVCPRFAASVAETMRRSPLKSLGFGIVALLATPLVVVMLVGSIIGVPLGLIALALYFVALAAGFLGTLTWIGDVGIRRFGRDPRDARSTRALSILLAAALSLVVSLIPVVGGLLLFVAWLLGIGALQSRLYKMFVARGTTDVT